MAGEPIWSPMYRLPDNERDVLAKALVKPDPLCRHEVGCIHCRSLAARGWRLVPSALPREALDVERLARALARYNDFAEDDHADIWTLLGEPGREAWRAKAAAIAREYAALAPEGSARDGG